MRHYLTACLAVLLTACGEDANSRFTDESHQRRVDLDSPSEYWQGEVTVELGGETDGERAIGRVGGLALGSDGIILVVDQYSHELRAFSADGAFLYSVGGRGAGPGEFQQACCLSWGPEGLLWVRDMGNTRYNVFSVSPTGATFQRTFPSAGSSMWHPAGFAADRVVDVSTMWADLGPEVRVAHFDPDGRLLRNVRPHPVPLDRIPHHRSESRSRTGTSGVVLFPLFGPRYEVAHAPTGDWAEVVTSEYRILWYDVDNNLRRVVHRDTGPPIELTAAERQWEREAWEQPFTDEARPKTFPASSTKPPISGLRFDGRGRLWVMLTTREADSCEADVIDVDGAYLARAAWPCEVGLSEGYIDDIGALGVARDRLGVERVVRLEWRRLEP